MRKETRMIVRIVESRNHRSSPQVNPPRLWTCQPRYGGVGANSQHPLPPYCDGRYKKCAGVGRKYFSVGKNKIGHLSPRTNGVQETTSDKKNIGAFHCVGLM